ncbi:MAG: ComEC family competence protein [Bacteroidetes bacterium]|nr:ComEC family competence protein [Bacteroidota bacterium]
MQPYQIPFWKTSPFCRLILPLIAGIIVQWYGKCSLLYIAIGASCCITAFGLLYLLPVHIRFRLQTMLGVLLMMIIGLAALFFTWNKDIRHDANWYGHKLSSESSLLVSITAPVIKKSSSLKATAEVKAIYTDGKCTPVNGKLLLYFSADSIAGNLQYGNCLLIRNTLQSIRNSGNPGAFNYERYGAFQQLYHTAFLRSTDWVLLEEKRINLFRQCIFYLQSKTIQIIRKYIDAGSGITSIAEALLIGYKEDLDRDLVQAYSNAGVVHIIAISGLHLGLIYVMLVWLFGRIPWIKKQKYIHVLLILACLWLFSLLTGASASVLRSAVMFSCVLVGKTFFKQASMYNALAASAFILLCYDPFLLWDVGFQLSYLAITGIVLLQKPMENILYVQHRWLRKIWSMLAVTIAAQVFTFPVCIFYFHQFPNLFFISNLLAVPLSTLILFGEIIIIAVSWISPLAVVLGKLTGYLIWLMNAIIIFCNKLPYAVTDSLYANFSTTIFLYVMVFATCSFLVNKMRSHLFVALFAAIAFVGVHALEQWTVSRQKKIIIYNTPKYKAIDFIYHDQYVFCGDSLLTRDGFLRNFHLKPARISLQVHEISSNMPGLFFQPHAISYCGRKLILIDTTIHFQPRDEKVKADILLLSKNANIRIEELLTALRPSRVVIDASNSLWKIAKWKKECLALALPCFSIPEQGAFVLDIE